MTIKAKIICDSINEAGNRLTTFEIEVPRIVWSEFMTHRLFSRNAASSRAIPFEKMLQQLDGIPSRFGAAQKGMQDGGEDFKGKIEWYEDIEIDTDRYGTVYECQQLNFTEPSIFWEEAKNSAIGFSKAFKEAGYHKQVYNRLTEPFQMIKAVVSATEYSNFFWLRDDVMADPTIAELARKMREAYDNSTPKLLKVGEWHLPYVWTEFDACIYRKQLYFLSEDMLEEEITLEQAIKVSAARCAAVSYRNEDYTLEKCLQLYERLVGDERKHASALEHMATPMNLVKGVSYCGGSCYGFDNDVDWEDGVSHQDREGNLWSGNFKGFIQYRKTIKGECYEAS